MALRVRFRGVPISNLVPTEFEKSGGKIMRGRAGWGAGAEPRVYTLHEY